MLAAEDRPLALFHGAVHVARDTAQTAPRFDLEPLPAANVPVDRLKTWFRRAVEVRDSDGAERVLQTAIAGDATPVELADMLLVAATDHVYLDAGHVLDFINKACEYLDVVGWSEAQLTLPSLVSGLCSAQRSEEQNAWRNPIDLLELMAPHLEGVPRVRLGDERLGDRFDALAGEVLQDDPGAGAAAISAALLRGVSADEVGQAVAHAAVLRIGRFPISNEFGDWDTVHNTWTSCQALAQALTRAPSVELVRGLYHAAMRIYLDRFLNVPPARLPDERASSNDLGAGRLETRLLELLDREQQVAAAASAVDETVAHGDADQVIGTLGHALLREDAEFHAYQTFEAGVRQYHALRAQHPLAARRTLTSITRYLAAHAPTPRAMHQTYQIAVRLLRGDDLSVAVAED